MNRRRFLQTGAMGASVLPEGSGRRLNVLHVISDQHQAACMGNEGHTQAITPNMDRLATEGVRFTRAYTQNPICTPSRVSIFSGQYCHNHGYYGLNGPPPAADLPSFLLHFRRHGYRTAAIGKVHVPDEPRNWIEGHCDFIGEIYRYFGISDLYGGYLRKLGLLEKEDSGSLPELPSKLWHEGRPSNLPYRHCVEGWCVTQATRFMDSAGDQPFCLQVSLPRPHSMYTPDRRFWEMYPDDLALPATLMDSCAHRPPHFQAMVQWLKKKQWGFEPKTFEAGCRRVWHGYLGCVTQVDFALGELLTYLEQTGKSRHTIVIYSADHGAYSGAYGVPEKAPGICSEAVCRVPFIWRVPGVTKAGHTYSHLVENVDIAPTITGLCGLPAMETVDGTGLTPALRGGDQPLREVAVTENPWSKAVRWGPWRFVHYPREMFGTDVGELYNVDNDPNESRNLYHEQSHQPLVGEGRRLLLEWMIRTTRFVTALPPPAGTSRSTPLRVAEDGRESNRLGIKERLRRGSVNYI